jgi:uncharacterized metal-binding protein YceD (DUF177 family)
MNRTTETERPHSSRDPSRDPWRAPVAVAQVPETGLHRDIEADPRQRQALADLAGLREVLSAEASFDVTPKKGGRFHVTGSVRGRVGQTCVVTLEEIENDIDEEIDLVFAPPELIPQMAALAEEAERSEAEMPDPPEPIENGVIDLGRLATDALFLGIDPYPRKADAEFEPVAEASDPEDHPFAALKALRAEPQTSGRNTPKGKSKGK